MNGHRVAVLIAAVVAALGAFLPWINMPIIGSVAGTAGGDGWLVVGGAAVGLLSTLSGDRAKPMSVGARVLALVSGAAVGGMGLWKILDVHNMKQHANADGFESVLSSAVSVGVGLYALVVAGVAMILLAGFPPKAN